MSIAASFRILITPDNGLSSLAEKCITAKAAAGRLPAWHPQTKLVLAYFEARTLDQRRRLQANSTMAVATSATPLGSGTRLILISHVPTTTGPGSYATNCPDWVQGSPGR